MQADVERVEDGAGAGDREVALEVALAVPGEGRDALALVDAERSEGVGEAVDAIGDLWVGAVCRAVGRERDDLPRAGVGAQAAQRVGQGELEVVLHQTGEHGAER